MNCAGQPTAGHRARYAAACAAADNPNGVMDRATMAFSAMAAVAAARDRCGVAVYADQIMDPTF